MNIRALIVGDDKDETRRLISVLESLDIWADVIHSSLITTSFGVVNHHHLLIIDTGNPQKDIDLCQALHPIFRGAKILFGAHSDESHQLMAYAAGADECIPTPVGTTLLRAKMRAWQQQIKKRYDLV
jgi:DNA-binding response OmpR family regulator